MSTDEGKPLTVGAQKLLERIVLGDILDDGILGARPEDRSFPLRLFFAELATRLTGDGGGGTGATSTDSDDDAAEASFAFASGLNFFFRAEMDPEAKSRVGVEVSKQFYALGLEDDLTAKAAPLLAAIMTQNLERVRLESVDHMKVFDSQVHERTEGSDATSSRIVRPASFLCRVAANNTVKVKAQVVT